MASSSSSPPNRSNWPFASSRFVLIAWSTASRWIASSPRRVWPSESNAPALDQRLDDALVAGDRVDLAEEVGEVGERAALGAGPDDRLDDVAADVADRGQPESDVGAGRGEVRVGGVDVGRQDLHAHAPALVEVERALVLVVADRGEQRRHVLGRVVRLEVGGPVGHQAVPGRVRLVERVVRERDEHVPQRLDRTLAVAPALHARLERDELRVEDLTLLLAHRLAQQVGLAERVAGHLLRDRQHLLLVDDHAERLAQDLARAAPRARRGSRWISWRPFLRSA